MSDTLTHTLLGAYQAHQHKLNTAVLYLACSGGRDSLSLAYACYQLYHAGKIKQLPVLLHVHHGWQTANDDWARRVATWASQHDFECRILQVKLPKNSETHARTARYDAMLSVMDADDVLMLAHHANDQAETVLFRLINGAGVQGLAGMKSWQSKSCADKQVWLWRPWLDVTRTSISEFANAHQLPFVDDTTNTDIAYARGRLRTLILPMLDQINPRAVDNIVRSAKLLGETAKWQQDSTDAHLAQLCHEQTQSAYQAVLDIEGFIKVPNTAQKATLHRWLQGDEPLPPSRQTTQRVLDLMMRSDNDHASQIFWQGVYHGYVLCCYDGLLYRYRDDVWRLLTAQKDADTASGATVGLTVNEGALVLLSNVQLSLTITSDSQVMSAKKIDKTIPVIIDKHTYKGKKLAQKLRLPPWLRSHLWRVHIGDDDWLIAPMRVWRWDDLTPVALDNFAPIGRMVYNG